MHEIRKERLMERKMERKMEREMVTRRGFNKIFLALSASCGIAFAAPRRSVDVAQALELSRKPYGDLFRGLDEHFTIDKKVYARALAQMRTEDVKDIGPITVRMTDLEKRRDALRLERKTYNDALLRAKVQFDRLESKRRDIAEKNGDTAAIDAELASIEAAADDHWKKSIELKNQLDGDTAFDFPATAERLDVLNDSLEHGALGDIQREMRKAEAGRIEAEIDAAIGINGRMRKTKKELELTEARNSHAFSKLRALRRWPERLRKINDRIFAGKHDERKHGDIENIGDPKKRKIDKVKVAKILPGMLSKDQEVQMGREIANELLKDPHVKLHTNERITEYINRLGQNLVRNSDAWCPFTFYTIADPPGNRELNAFALPGGVVFVHDTLILTAQSESELAGVLAHEITHVNARHAARMFSKGQYMQYAALAGVIFGGIGYLAYQGIGMGLNVAMLGISRGSETEADILGVQTLWNAGYDPRALIDMFDRMLKYQRLGASSFWRTHPSTDDRMERAEEEVRYLPAKNVYAMGSSEYTDVQTAIRESRLKINKSRKDEEKAEKKPTMYREGDKRPGDEEPDTPPVLRRNPKPGKEEEGQDPEDAQGAQEAPPDDPDRPRLKRKDPPAEQPKPDEKK